MDYRKGIFVWCQSIFSCRF